MTRRIQEAVAGCCRAIRISVWRGENEKRDGVRRERAQFGVKSVASGGVAHSSSYPHHACAMISLRHGDDEILRVPDDDTAVVICR
eukprot:scaffold34676_cov176-Amphora_coffeaeformis.AAC.9